MGTTAKERRSIREQAEDAGIHLACLATSLSYADPSKTEDMIRKTHERIDLAGDVGAPVIRVFGGRIPEGATREQAIDLLVRSLGEVAGHAGAGSGPDFQLVPIGSGDIDHRRAVELLKEIQYEGFLSGEWIKWEPYETHLPRELAVMKRFETVS